MPRGTWWRLTRAIVRRPMIGIEPHEPPAATRPASAISGAASASASFGWDVPPQPATPSATARLDAVRQPGRQDIRQPELADLCLGPRDLVGVRRNGTQAGVGVEQEPGGAGSPSRGWPTEPGLRSQPRRREVELRCPPARRPPASASPSRRDRERRRGCDRRARAAPRSRARQSERDVLGEHVLPDRVARAAVEELDAATLAGRLEPGEPGPMAPRSSVALVQRARDGRVAAELVDVERARRRRGRGSRRAPTAARSRISAQHSFGRGP